MEATFGKCNFRNLQNGILCGCLRSRVHDYSCRACDHDLCYHEKINVKPSQRNSANNNTRNNRRNKLNPYKRSIVFKLICLFGGKPNQKIPRE